MERKNKIYQSFASRLTWKVLSPVLIIMYLTLTASFIAAYRGMKGETTGRYLGMLNVVTEKIQKNIQSIEIGAANVFDEVEHHLDSPEAVIAALDKEIRLNNYVEGYFVAFEPDYFPLEGRWFEPYIRKQENGSFLTTQVGSEQHDYLNADWYERAKIEKKAFWTDPYFYRDSTDFGGVFCTYVKPIIGEGDRVIGVCGADLLLENLIKDLQKIDNDSKSKGMQNIDKRYSHLDFYSFIVNSDGTYIAHPDKERILKGKIHSFVEKNRLYGDFKRVVNDMAQKKNGIAPLKIDDVWSDVYYTPLASTNWTLAIVVPKRALVQPIFILLLSLLSATGLGQILAWRIVRKSIRKTVKPLEALTTSAEEVAKGNFEAPLPVLEHKDEICKLRDSFETMQHSLVDYMEELKSVTAQKERIDSELRIAREIQMSMVPNKFPQREGLDMCASMVPAKEVGGDLYGYLLQDEKLYFCVGDVSGKGVPASLFMTQATRLFRALATQHMMPAEMCTLINQALAGEDNKKCMFVTIFLGLLDLQTGHLDFCNAGHNAPVIGGGDEHGEYLKILPNAPIGLMPGFQFKGEAIDSIKGRPLFVYSDGLNEAENNEGKLFGNERLLDLLRKTDFENARQVIETMTAEVDQYRNGAEPNDDLTMMVIHCK